MPATDRTCLNTTDCRVCMPTRHYGVVVPESQKVPCLISTYQRAYGSRTTDRPYVMEVRDA